jgi:hypothetical protein
MGYCILVIGALAVLGLFMSIMHRLVKRDPLGGSATYIIDWPITASLAIVTILGAVALLAAAASDFLNAEWLRWVAVGSGVLLLTLLGIVRFQVGGHR